MTAWWTAREPRERLLLMIAAIVAVVALIVQLILVPALRGREDAALALAESQGTLVRLERLKAAGTVYRPAVSPMAPAESAALAAGWAADMGLVFQQEPAASGYRFAFSPAEPTVVFAWAGRVETELGLPVQSAELVSSDQGRVQAVFLIGSGPTP